MVGDDKAKMKFNHLLILLISILFLIKLSNSASVKSTTTQKSGGNESDQDEQLQASGETADPENPPDHDDDDDDDDNGGEKSLQSSGSNGLKVDQAEKMANTFVGAVVNMGMKKLVQIVGDQLHFFKYVPGGKIIAEGVTKKVLDAGLRYGLPGKITGALSLFEKMTGGGKKKKKHRDKRAADDDEDGGSSDEESYDINSEPEHHIFFRGDKFCKRKKDQPTDEDEFQDVPDDQKYREKEIGCTWMPNTALFGCKMLKQVPAAGPTMKKFCQNPIVTASGFTGKLFHVFSGKNLLQFDGLKGPFGIFGNFVKGGMDLAKKIGLGSLPFHAFGEIAGNFLGITKGTFSMFKPNDKGIFQKFSIGNILDKLGRKWVPDFIALPMKAAKGGLDFLSNTVIKLFSNNFFKTNGEKKHDTNFRKKGHFWEFQGDQNEEGEQTLFAPGEYPQQKYPPGMTGRIDGLPDKHTIFFKKTQHCKTQKEGVEDCDFAENSDLFRCNEKDELYKGGDKEKLKDGIEKLCQNPLVNLALNANGKIYVFRDNKYWIFDTDNKNLIGTLVFGPATAQDKWEGWDQNNDAFFYDNDRFIMFLPSKRWYSWYPDGRPDVIDSPMKEGEKDTKDDDQEEKEKEDKKGKKDSKLTYQDKDVIELCQNPKSIVAADSNDDGSMVYIFTKNKYFVVEGLHEGTGIGNVTKKGFHQDLWQRSETTHFRSFVTVKEGWRRGFMYQFMNNRNFKSWTPFPYAKIWADNQFYGPTMPEDGFDALLHNRDFDNPTLIGLKKDMVYYYTTEGTWFYGKGRPQKASETEEKFPPDVTAAFSMPGPIIYLFKGDKYCARELLYKGEPPMCPKWIEIKHLLGCYGKDKSENNDYIEKYKKGKDEKQNEEGQKSFCQKPNINAAMKTWKDDYYIFREKNYFKLKLNSNKEFKIVDSGEAANKWKNFPLKYDGVCTIEESHYRRGYIFAFNNGYYFNWKPNNKPYVNNAYWGQPIPSKKFTFIMHNGDVADPYVIGSDGKFVHYYSTADTQLSFIKKEDIKKDEHKFPPDAKGALKLDNNNVFFFKDDKFCKRPFKCNDESTFCCKEWKNNKDLFGCDGKTLKQSEWRKR